MTTHRIKWRGALLLLAVHFALVVILAPPAHASHTREHLADAIVVSANRDKVNETLHVAAIMGTRQGNDLTWDVFWADWAKAHMDLTGNSFERTQFELHKAQQAYREKYHESDVARQAKGAQEFVNDLMAFLANDPTGVSAIAGKGVEMSFRESVLKPWLKDAELADGIVVARDNGQRADDVLRTVTDRIKAQRIEALANPAYKKLIDQEYVNKSNIQVGFTTQEILRNSPALRTLTGVNQLINDVGAINATLGRLRNEVRAGFTQVNGQLAAIHGRLEVLDAQQKDLLAYADRAEERERIRLENEQAAARAQLELDAQKSGVYILSTLVGLADPKFGRDIALIGNATIQVADSLNKWSKAMASFADKSGKITDAVGAAMSSAVMGGNILGAAMSLAPLFVDTGPTPEQMVLEQVGALRDQVSSLQTQMHDRFDRLDSSLNQLFGATVEGFNKMADGQGRIIGGVRRLEHELNRLQTTINRFEGNVYEIVADAEGRKLWLAIDGGIGYEARSGGLTMPFTPGFLDYESLFHMWATNFAFDAVATGSDVSKRPVSDDDVLAELEKYPTDANINYLARFAQQNLGVGSFLAGKAPNPRQWALATRAASALDVEWPQHAARVPRSRSADRTAIGRSLEADLRRITDTSDAGEAPKPNRELWAELFENYRDNAKSLQDALADLEKDYLERLDNDGTANGSDLRLDIWAGADQAVRPQDDVAYSPTMHRCGGPGSRTSVSEATFRALLPQHALVGRRLRMGDVRFCYRLSWDRRWIVNGVGDTEPGEIPVSGAVAAGSCTATLKTRAHCGTLRIEVGSSFDHAGEPVQWQPLRTRTYVTGPIRICSEQVDLDGNVINRCPAEVFDPERHLNGWDSGLREQFEMDSTVVEAPLDEELRKDVDDRLKDMQMGLYAEILQSFQGGQLVGAARRFSGAKAAIDQFVILGLPRALENDEFLRALLFGSPDAEKTPRVYAGELAQLAYLQATAGPKNPRMAIVAETERRIALLEQTVSGYLDLVGNGKWVESQRFLTTALSRAGIVEAYVGIVAERLKEARPGPKPQPHVDLEPEPADTRAPAVSARAPKQSLRAVLSKGLRLRVASDEAGRVHARLVLDGRTAKSVALGKRRPVVVGSANATLVTPGQRQLVIRFQRTARAKLGRLKKITLTLRVTVVDAAGNTGRATRQVTIKR